MAAKGKEDDDEYRSEGPLEFFLPLFFVEGSRVNLTFNSLSKAL